MTQMYRRFNTEQGFSCLVFFHLLAKRVFVVLLIILSLPLLYQAMFLRPTVLLNAAAKVTASRIATPALFSRMYATLPKEDVQTRVLDVVRSFEKVDASKVNYSQT